MKDFLDDLQKEYGEDILKKRDKLAVISTGSLALDISTGVGGIPKAKFTEIYGPESSGKTTLAFEIFKNCLANGENALFIDAENAIDFSYMEKVTGHKFRENSTVLVDDNTDASGAVIQPETGEMSLNIIEKGLISGEFGLIILDSVGALSPKEEKEKDLEDSTVALTSRLLSKFFRRMSFFVRKHDIAVVFLNQVRAKIGGYVAGYESPGGYALKHYTSLRIFLGKGQIIKQGKDSIGVLTPFTIKKNKVAQPFGASTFPIISGEGIDYIRDVINFAKFLGVIKLRGSHYVISDGEHIGHGMNNVIEFLKENETTLDKIVEMCYNNH